MANTYLLDLQRRKINALTGVTWQFGNPPTDYVQIAGTDGHLTLHGDARQWEDLRVEPAVRGAAGAKTPTFESWFDSTGLNVGGTPGVCLYSFDDAVLVSEKEIFFTAQMPHTWDSSTNLHLHVHWIASVADTTATPRWGLELHGVNPALYFQKRKRLYMQLAMSVAIQTYLLASIIELSLQRLCLAQTQMDYQLS